MTFTDETAKQAKEFVRKELEKVQKDIASNKIPPMNEQWIKHAVELEEIIKNGTELEYVSKRVLEARKKALLVYQKASHNRVLLIKNCAYDISEMEGLTDEDVKFLRKYSEGKQLEAQIKSLIRERLEKQIWEELTAKYDYEKSKELFYGAAIQNKLANKTMELTQDARTREKCVKAIKDQDIIHFGHTVASAKKDIAKTDEEMLDDLYTYVESCLKDARQLN